MAKIWFVKKGKSLTLSISPIKRSLHWCINNLNITAENYKAPLEAPPEFSDNTSPDQMPQFVVIAIQRKEASKHISQWKPGFYFSSLSIDEATARLQDPI